MLAGWSSTPGAWRPMGALASGEGWHDRARAPRAQRRTRRRCAAERALWSERGLVSHQHADLQRAQCAQEARAAGALQGGATEAIALRAIHSGRRTRRAPDPPLATNARQ